MNLRNVRSLLRVSRNYSSSSPGVLVDWTPPDLESVSDNHAVRSREFLIPCRRCGKTLILNSAENGKFVIMASTIGIPSPPVLKVTGETLETSLRNMSEGLQLHRALLQGVITRLANKDTVTGLLFDTRDLLIQIHKMLKMVQTESQVQPTAPTLALHLPGDYEVQVATHLTLVQFQSFGLDMVRVLQNINQEDDQSTDS